MCLFQQFKHFEAWHFIPFFIWVNQLQNEKIAWQACVNVAVFRQSLQWFGTDMLGIDKTLNGIGQGVGDIWTPCLYIAINLLRMAVRVEYLRASVKLWTTLIIVWIFIHVQVSVFWTTYYMATLFFILLFTSPILQI